MFGPDLRLWLLGLGPDDAVLLVRQLAIAEASRLRLGLGAVNLPGDIYTGDGGVDGQTDLGPTPLAPFPAGRCSWQIKATINFSVNDELQKAGVRADITDGRNYVIVCTQELIGRRRTLRNSAITEGVRAIDGGRMGAILGVEDVERLIRIHPTVPGLMGGPQPLGMPLDVWARPLMIDRFPFIDDPGRQAQVDQIREFAEGTDHRYHFHVFGDSGVGKSRAAYEALQTEGLRGRVAAHFTYSEEVRRALVQAAATEETRAVIVVDEVDPLQMEGLRTAAAAAQGRIRLITIGDRQSRFAEADATSIEILPLPEGAIRPLVSRVGGIDEEDAGFVASLSEGYPKLAVLLAEAIRDARGRGPLIAIIRGHQIDQLLTEMIRDTDTRSHLAHISLVNRLGYVDELETEARQLCDAFGLPYLGFRASVDRETGRFVATAGRYRRVSPQAFAVWLAQGLIEAAPDRFVEAIGRLEEPLYGSFRLQLQDLGGNETFDRAMREVMAHRAATFRGLTSLTSADAQLLNAVAFASPELGAHHISGLVAGASVTELREFNGDQRRSLVWALQHLLWFNATYEIAALALLALAANETETWANNATGVLTESFQVLLGGTEVSLDRRFAWLHEHAHDYSDDSLRVAIRAVAASLQPNETRTGGWRGARLQPVEWRPMGPAEIHRLHQQALNLLVEWAGANGETLPEIAKTLSAAIWVLVRSADADAFVAAVRQIEWHSEQRAEILTAVRRELAYNSGLPPESAEALMTLAEHLEGGEPASRVAALMATQLWELDPGRNEPGPPPVLEALAVELAAMGLDLLVATIASLENAKASTTFTVFRLLGERYPELGSLTGDDRLPVEARVGFVSGLGLRDTGSVMQVLQAWRTRPADAALVPWAVSTLDATPELANLALDVVSTGRAPLRELNRLRYGRWVSDLPVENIRGIIELYLGHEPDPFDLEAAIGMLEVWVEAHPDSATAVLDLGADLFDAAAAAEGRGLLAYGRNRLADRLALPTNRRLLPTLRAIEESGHPDSEDVAAIARMAHEAPDDVVPTVIDLVVSANPRRFLVEDAHLLSVVARAAGDGRVLNRLVRLPGEQQERALRHLDFTTPTLDPVVVGLLEAHQDDPEFTREATTRFIFPGEVVMGPYSRRFEERLSQVRQIQNESASEAVKHWAESTAAALMEIIPGEVQREAEWR